MQFCGKGAQFLVRAAIVRQKYKLAAKLEVLCENSTFLLLGVSKLFHYSNVECFDKILLADEEYLCSTQVGSYVT